MATYLDAILAAHHQRAAADGRAPVRDFKAALRRSDGIAVIAEIKRRSPSKGALAPNDLDAAALTADYERGGAVALSVLTDEAHFGGSPADLRAARDATAIPVLRKDFTVCEADVVDARAMGADAVLLIVAALDDAELKSFAELARHLHLAALVEAHDEDEVERALRAGADIVGVNQRDLVTFEVDTDRAARVAAAIPDTVVKVAESGIRSPDDAKRLRDAGYDSILVGEHLVTSGDPAAAVRKLVVACS